MTVTVPAGVEMPTPGLLRLSATAAFASAISMRVGDPMLPALSREFGVTMSAAAPVIGLFAVAYGVTQLIYGPIGQRHGAFRVAAWSTLLAGLASLVCVLAPGLNALMLGRLLTGASTAGIIPTLFAWLGERVPYEKRQLALARVVSGTTLGAVCGQAMGGLLVDTVGWRWAFVLPTLLFMLCGMVMLRYSYSVRPRGGPAQGPPISLPNIVDGYRTLLGRAWVRKVLAIVGLEGLLLFSAIALMPAYLHERYGIAIWHAGLVSALFGLGGFIYTAIAPRLLAGLGQANLVRLGWAGCTTALLSVVLAPHWALAAIACLVLGVCFYCQHNTLQLHGTQMDPDRRGLAISAFATLYFGGQALGVFVATAWVHTLGFAALFSFLALALALLGAWFESALRQKHGGDHAVGG